MGLILLCTGSIIIGGIKSIGKVTEKLVPLMAAIYIISCLFIIISNYKLLPETLSSILTSAFNLDASIGGFIVL